MAAAKPVRQNRQARQQGDRKAVIAAAESHQGAAGRQAELARGLAVARRQLLVRGQPSLQALRTVPVTRADKGQHGMHVVKAAKTIVDVRRPGGAELGPAVARVASDQLHAPQQRCAIDQVGDLARVPSPNVPVIQGQRAIELALRQAKQRQMPPARRGDACQSPRQVYDLVHIAVLLGDKSVKTTQRLASQDPHRMADRLLAKAIQLPVVRCATHYNGSQ